MSFSNINYKQNYQDNQEDSQEDEDEEEDHDDVGEMKAKFDKIMQNFIDDSKTPGAKPAVQVEEYKN